MLVRAHGRFQRTTSRHLYRRPIPLRLQRPLISFTFDDFPKSALYEGGQLLADVGARGTYYASMGLMGTLAPTSEIFVPEDLPALLNGGHELACHTFDHFDSWDTVPSEFDASILRNREALAELAPSVQFESFSFPITQPRPATKRLAARHFESCRGGGQTPNIVEADLALLNSYFLEKSGGLLDPVRQVIEENRSHNGWLIFSTHDISPSPTPYGCTPSYFRDVIRAAVDSGATILPVKDALRVARGDAPGSRSRA